MRHSNHSRATVHRLLDYWLAHPPAPRYDFSQVRYIICDGTFVHKTIGIYAIMDAETHRIIFAAYNVRESSRQLPALFAHLAALGLSPRSATVDGNPQQQKCLRATWPSLIIQRCLVHVQRQGLDWCRVHPRSTAAKHLRRLFLMLSRIKTHEQRDQFLASFAAWEHRFGPSLAVSLNRGWVFSDLLRARSMLRNALPSLFRYLDDPKISTSTNPLEGSFMLVKEKYRCHRGLSKPHRQAFFQWYFFLKFKEENKEENT